MTSLSVLVVEDDDDLREAIVDSLTILGHRVRGIDCAEALPEQRDLLQIDLIVLDLNLPGEDGLSMLKRLRLTNPRVGIIVLSARAAPGDRAAGYELGADIFISKPASAAELREAVVSLARRLGVARWDSPCLLVEKRRYGYAVTWNNEAVGLTPGEVLLLVAWGGADQRVLRHAEIAEVLNLSGPTTKALIELHISRLRKKLSALNSDVAPIRSVRGVGYQFCLPMMIAAG